MAEREALSFEESKGAPEPAGFEDEADDRRLPVTGARPPPAPKAPAPAGPAKDSASQKKGERSGFGGLVDKLKKAISPAPRDGGRRTLTGRVLRQHGKRLDIEIVLDATLDWEPYREVVVELADGTTVKAEVNFSFTTSNGVYGPGLVVTLTLTTPAELRDPARIQLVSNGQSVEVVLSE